MLSIIIITIITIHEDWKLFPEFTPYQKIGSLAFPFQTILQCFLKIASNLGPTAIAWISLASGESQ